MFLVTRSSPREMYPWAKLSYLIFSWNTLTMCQKINMIITTQKNGQGAETLLGYF
jgi:hypothetical protein